MSVFLKNKRWANSRVPYLINLNPHQAQVWFGEVNSCMGFDLLVPKEASDINYIQVNIGGDSKSEEIGCKGAGMQTIGGSKKFTVIHELLHALGFKHEQLHCKFPWDDTDPQLKAVNRMYSYKGKSKTENNKKLYSALSKAVNEFYADNNLNSRLEAMLDPQTEHWGDCDLNSVMMYGLFATALTAVGLDKQAGVISSGISLQCDVLSNQDVAALLSMYPAPPPPAPPPPRDFTVKFSGLPHDSLKLSFLVRSTGNPGRVSRYTADASGCAVVRGFNPDQVEIRVEPWPQWSRVKFNPPTRYMLPGGRYTYTVT